MARELKFRVWYKNFNYNKGGWIKPSFGTIWEGDNEDQLSSSDNDTIIMQYTGLKDKNGMEIYEGDIVSVDAPTDRNNYEICYADGMWRFVKDDHAYYDVRIFKDATSVCEVIGNIYETPELLNTEPKAA